MANRSKVEVKQMGGYWRVLIGGKIYKTFTSQDGADEATKEAARIAEENFWCMSNSD